MTIQTPKALLPVKAPVVEAIQAAIPGVLAVYAFGSRMTGDAHPGSDLDLAVLVPGYADPLRLFELAGELADVVGCDVDLVDLRAASTVMQYQIIMKGVSWWHADTQAGLYEAFILSEKTALDTARAGLMEDIAARGHVYGR